MRTPTHQTLHHTPAHDVKEQLVEQPEENLMPNPTMPESAADKKERERLEKEAKDKREKAAAKPVDDAIREHPEEEQAEVDKAQAKAEAKGDPKKLIAEANELFQRASARPGATDLLDQAKAKVNEALALDPHILDEAEPKEKLKVEV